MDSCRSQRQRLRIPLFVVFLALVFPCVLTTSAAEEDYAGDETCAMCHEEIVAAFGKTAHALAPGWDDEVGCESCHGPGTAHAEADGDVTMIKRAGEMTPRENSETCLACHQRQEKHFSSMQSIHRLGDVGCNDCHNPHSTAGNLLDVSGRELCGSCHQAIDAQFDLARSHPLPDEGNGCANCHSPHATRSLRTDTSMFRETCTECHFEKAGPFLYDHDVVMVDGCVSCHDVHGSSNRHLLKHEPQVNLCYQCHSASVTPTWHSAPRFLNEKCTACHTAIHGSNTNPFFLEE